MDLKEFRNYHAHTILTYLVLLGAVVFNSYLSHVYKLFALFLISVQFIIFYISRFDLEVFYKRRKKRVIKVNRFILLFLVFFIFSSLLLVKAFVINSSSRIAEIGQSIDSRAFFILFMTTLISLMFIKKEED